MSLRRVILSAGFFAVISFSGCGGGSTASTSLTVEVTGPTAPIDSVIDSVTSETTQASSTTVVATTADDGIARINVTVGVDSGPDRIEEVPLGSQVELTLVNPEEDDEFHLHGYDLGGDETPAGEEKVFAFAATEAGDFEVESHATSDVLVVIRVS